MYETYIRQNQISTLEDLLKLFDKDISDEWVRLYKERCDNYYGDITIQRFFNFTFVFDSTRDPQNQGIDGCSIPDNRVIGVFGITSADIHGNNRALMKKSRGHAGAYECYGGKYDRGHFIAHMAGGQIDINLFPQRRDVNRGWRGMGRYREMERHVASHPGLLVFSRAIYSDFSCCPYEIEYGYIDRNLNLCVEVFPNKYSSARD